MTNQLGKATEPARRERAIPTASAILDTGAVLEMVYRPRERRSAFVLWQDGTWRYEASLKLDLWHRLVPYSPHNNLIQNEVVLLPSEPEEYGSEEALIGDIQSFIHRYVDLTPLFEKLTSYYVLLSWVYDRFNELPYLRLRGDPGSGKTRCLLIVGSLCYKPIFASGASTVSPLFRILDAFRGTLLIDEGDFRLSDERAEVVKILNNGNARGFPVLRSEASPQREFNPRAYAVFGPKVVATRGFFEDRALESRFITEEMGQFGLRDDIPISLPEGYKEEALRIRNKLLLFRFRNLGRHVPLDGLVDRGIEPRLNQIFAPLLSMVDDPGARTEIRELARRYNREIVAERGADMEAQILEIIREMLASSPDTRPSVKEITNWFNDRYGADYDRRVTTRWVGSILRKKLHLKTQKSHGVFVIPVLELPRLDRLYERYGIDTKEAEARDDQPRSDS